MAEHYFSLSNQIVKDSLKSLDFDKNKTLFIVGGLVPQLYGQFRKDIHRKTLDLDMVSPEKFSFEDFQENILDSQVFLKNLKYQTQFKKGRGNYSLKVMSSQNKKDSKNFFINFDYIHPNIYDFFNDYVQKQFSNSKLIEFDSNLLRVESLEELFPMKINRLLNKSKNSDLNLVGDIDFFNKILKSKFSDLAKINMSQLNKGIEFYQTLFSNGKVKSEGLKNYKVLKDLFDLSASAKIIQDKQYDFDPDRYNKNLERVLTPKL